MDVANPVGASREWFPDVALCAFIRATKHSPERSVRHRMGDAQPAAGGCPRFATNCPTAAPGLPPSRRRLGAK